jgi:acetyl-CoA acetyltransferase
MENRMTRDSANSARILGIGRTPFYKSSGRSMLDLALAATKDACSDAGVPLSSIDGAVTFGLNDTITSISLLNTLGCEVKWYTDLQGGANIALSSVILAAQVVNAGLAERIVVFRAINSRSGLRLGGIGTKPPTTGDAQFSVPVGWATYGQIDAACARRHMEIYGSTSEQFGAVAVAASQWAAKNEWAVRKQPLTLEDHQNSPMIADPFRLYDFCLESDCGFAVVIGRPGASANASREIRIDGSAQGGGPRPGSDPWGRTEWHEHAHTFGKYIGERLFRDADTKADDIGIICLYDCFTFVVISSLEAFGFVKYGEAGPLAASGALGPGGSRPVNTHGGLLSEGYAHSFNHLYEAAVQLRGEAGARQLRDNETALVTSGATTTGSALILRRAS